VALGCGSRAFQRVLKKTSRGIESSGPHSTDFIGAEGIGETALRAAEPFPEGGRAIP
jgi:hypothetical protein